MVEEWYFERPTTMLIGVVWAAMLLAGLAVTGAAYILVSVPEWGSRLAKRVFSYWS